MLKLLCRIVRQVALTLLHWSSLMPKQPYPYARVFARLSAKDEIGNYQHGGDLGHIDVADQSELQQTLLKLGGEILKFTDPAHAVPNPEGTEPRRNQQILIEFRWAFADGTDPVNGHIGNGGLTWELNHRSHRFPVEAKQLSGIFEAVGFTKD